MILKDTCVSSFSDLVTAIDNETHRVTLTNQGTTVSKGFMAEATKYAHEHHIAVNVLIDTKTTNPYHYSDIELKILEANIFEAQALGVDSVEFFSLNNNEHPDFETLSQLLAACGGMEGTINLGNNVFDSQTLAIISEWVNQNNIPRVYTSTTNISELKKQIQYFPMLVPSSLSTDEVQKLEIHQIQI